MSVVCRSVCSPVGLSARKPNCEGLSLVSSILVSVLSIIFSSILPKMGRRPIGR